MPGLHFGWLPAHSVPTAAVAVVALVAVTAAARIVRLGSARRGG